MGFVLWFTLPDKPSQARWLSASEQELLAEDVGPSVFLPAVGQCGGHQLALSMRMAAQFPVAAQFHLLCCIHLLAA
jgi:hypothetical protein